jgi:mRNA interferase MazF
MTICERLDVVVVPFPFVDAARSKSRPALVLSTSTFNEANGHAVLAMITRAERTQWPSDHPIADLERAGLPRPSVVRWKIFTLDDRLLMRRIGRLSSPDAKACRVALLSCLGLAG